MLQDPFDQKKAVILAGIQTTTLGEIPDASPKGSIDELCIPIIDLINSHEDMVTTSSCSGRVSVFVEGIKTTAKNTLKTGGKGDGGYWLFVTHDANELQGWYHDKFDANMQEKELQHSQTTRYILYKFEPLVLHVKCRNYATACSLYTTAMGCGFRESGIGVNNIVAIRISIRLDVPIGVYREDRLLCFVEDAYLKIITQLSLDRFKENSKRLNALFAAIEAMEVKQTAQETKEQRRERKKKEGLERQKFVSQNRTKE